MTVMVLYPYRYQDWLCPEEATGAYPRHEGIS
jgi:hypothetical protein